MNKNQEAVGIVTALGMSGEGIVNGKIFPFLFRLPFRGKRSATAW